MVCSKLSCRAVHQNQHNRYHGADLQHVWWYMFSLHVHIHFSSAVEVYHFLPRSLLSYTLSPFSFCAFSSSLSLPPPSLSFIHSFNVLFFHFQIVYLHFLLLLFLFLSSSSCYHFTMSSFLYLNLTHFVSSTSSLFSSAPFSRPFHLPVLFPLVILPFFFLLLLLLIIVIIIASTFCIRRSE